MTATIEQTDLDLDVLEQLDWQPPCEFEGCKAGHPPATHVFTHLWCGCMWLECVRCITEDIAYLATHWTCLHPGWKCARCNQQVDPTIPFRLQTKITSLKGTS